VVPVVVQGPAVASSDAPVVASVPKEPENVLLLNAAPTPLSVAVSKGNVESSSLSDDDSSDSGSEESDSGSGSDGSDSSSTTSSMTVMAVVGLPLNQCTTICWFLWVLSFMFRLNLYELDYVVS